jgi:magnesium-transporting ATPase (P-type)
VLAFLAALTLICLAFRRAGLLRETITVEHYHDLGKWLFALTVFWAYIAFSQYLLIWYANIPEETIWFRHRLEGNWAWVSALLLLGHFVVPFVVLLARAAKRNLAVLGAISGWILLMHLVDLHWVVMPTIHAHSFHLHWMDIATWVGIGSVYALVFWSGLRRHAMVPVGDLRFEQGLHFRNV